ncbi:uncharacterized protein LOC103936895 [Pyrus x bretschneideri]|uniref:uncharacterized protein LOC103936895 n=1 Tax=Pyrus x bretschneideri TaxID=225117 RepID=UPI00202E82FB|nr:uncharacterized protein LOC103936895 [Pyrus x bretschneideri]
MATNVTSKSLLPLSQLKWTKNDETTTQNDNPCQQLSSNKKKLAELHLEAEKSGPKSSNVKNRADPVPSTEVTEGAGEIQKPKPTATEKKSNLCIRLKIKEKIVAAAENEPKPKAKKELSLASLAAEAAVEELEEGVQKTWNLRPRRPVTKANGRTGALKTGAPPPPEKKTQESIGAGSSKAGGKGKSAQNKDNKPKISIELTREEIEEDLFIMTGQRPSRRPKKRNKNVQKQLDNLFPGLWMNSVSRESYQVPETPKDLIPGLWMNSVSWESY